MAGDAAASTPNPANAKVPDATVADVFSNTGPTAPEPAKKTATPSRELLIFSVPATKVFVGFVT